MDLIRGITIELIDGDNSETVENVLVGEPACENSGDFPITSFTLAIPKDDKHDWINKKVRFFGMIFRTVGLPVMGIESLIPGSWNARIKVESYTPNGSITIYRAGTYERIFIPSVYLTDTRTLVNRQRGDEKRGELSVTVFGCDKAKYTPQINDLIIVGECNFEFSKETEREVSESMAELRRIFPNYGAVFDIRYEMKSTSPDLKIKAR